MEADPFELSEQEEEALEAVSQGTFKFAIDLYRAAASRRSGNVFVSPLSLQVVLALAYTGAGGDTAEELRTLLSLPESLQDTCLGYQSLLRLLQPPVLNVANRIFVEKTAGVKKQFQKDAENYFRFSAKALDFRTSPEKSREHINSWVKKKTDKKITNLLQPGIINKYTRLVLVNAIHFKAAWWKPFDEQDTKNLPFHISKSKTVQVEMMHTKKKFKFDHDDELKAKILQLKYVDRNFRMTLILPDDIEGLEALEEKLQSMDLNKKTTDMYGHNVSVALPKFKVEETVDLKENLKSLGAESMFNPRKANFSKLSREPLFVSEVVQKAVVEVNEKGTEAAVATFGKLTLCCLRGRPPIRDETFIADHPFIFFITSEVSNSTLFVGRYSVPPV